MNDKIDILRNNLDNATIEFFLMAVICGILAQYEKEYWLKVLSYVLLGASIVFLFLLQIVCVHQFTRLAGVE